MKSVHQRPLGTTQYPFTPPLLLEEETYSKRDSLNQDGIPGGRVASIPILLVNPSSPRDGSKLEPF